MRYTWPKFKLCRREWVNLFWIWKYDVKKRRKLPWQHWANIPRLNEYWKMLRNKQLLKRVYMLSEKQFKRIVMDQAQKYSKNKWIDHDKAVLQFLEKRLDSVILATWLASTIMQARQIVTHWHLLLNWNKHNIPSYFVKKWDIITVKDKLKSSSLYSNSPLLMWTSNIPSWLSVNSSELKIEVVDNPNSDEITVPADVLKVIEYYARA